MPPCSEASSMAASATRESMVRVASQDVAGSWRRRFKKPEDAQHKPDMLILGNISATAVAQPAPEQNITQVHEAEKLCMRACMSSIHGWRMLPHGKLTVANASIRPRHFIKCHGFENTHRSGFRKAMIAVADESSTSSAVEAIIACQATMKEKIDENDQLLPRNLHPTEMRTSGNR
mmetsp:Transcript_3188/g.8563  ORF Transcript_3188/g.8563 Transcript_3188/m.8563 type:complete len:176 (-) Transcript_3188:446-973(-)